MADQWSRPDLTVPPPTLDEIEVKVRRALEAVEQPNYGQYTTDGKYYIQGNGNTWTTSIYAPGRQRVPSPVPSSNEHITKLQRDLFDDAVSEGVKRHKAWVKYLLSKMTYEERVDFIEHVSAPDQRVVLQLLKEIDIALVDAQLAKNE